MEEEGEDKDIPEAEAAGDDNDDEEETSRGRGGGSKEAGTEDIIRAKFAIG